MSVSTSGFFSMDCFGSTPLAGCRPASFDQTPSGQSGELFIDEPPGLCFNACMKTKLVILLAAISLVLGGTPARADDEGAAIIADAVIARPACLAATVVGSAFFVLILPFSAATKSIRSTADALVVTPAKATFTRPLGDFDSLRD
jgi:hypothetical protein